MDAAADLLVGEVAEPALDLVDPRRSGRGEVHVEAGVAGQPLAGPRGSCAWRSCRRPGGRPGPAGTALSIFFRNFRNSCCAVAAVQLADDGAVGDVEGGEQAGDAVADVVVGAALGHAGHHRQHRLGAVQGLDLALLV